MLWQTEKPREPQCLTVTLLCKLWHHRKVKHTGCPFGWLPTHSGRDPSASDFSATFSWCQQETACDGEVSLQRRLYTGEYSEMVCTFRGWVQGTGIKVSTKLGGNGEAFKLVWVRPSGKPWGPACLDAHLTFLTPLMLSEEGFSPQGVASEQTALPQLWQGCWGSRAATGSAAHGVLQHILLPVLLLSPQPFD